MESSVDWNFLLGEVEWAREDSENLLFMKLTDFSKWFLNSLNFFLMELTVKSL